MNVTVAYWEHGHMVERDGADWSSLPVDGVLWVDVERGDYLHRLRGADGYWVDGDRFGATFEWAKPRFGGVLYAFYRWLKGKDAESMGEMRPPEGVRVLRGVMVPDDIWEGLIR